MVQRVHGAALLHMLHCRAMDGRVKHDHDNFLSGSRGDCGPALIQLVRVDELDVTGVEEADLELAALAAQDLHGLAVFAPGILAVQRVDGREGPL